MNNLIHKIDVSKHIAHHIAGKDHTVVHRRITGGIIMALGVGLVKLSLMSPIPIIHFFGDLVGFAIHGIGLIPFIKGIEEPEKKTE